MIGADMDLLVYDPSQVCSAALAIEPIKLAPPYLTTSIRHWLAAVSRWAEAQAMLAP